MKPKLASGRPLHHLGTGYVVLMDGTKERSVRKPVGIWIGWERVGEVKLVIEPLDTDTRGDISLEATGYATHFACFLDGDGPIQEWRLEMPALKRSPVTLKFGEMFEAML